MAGSNVFVVRVEADTEGLLGGVSQGVLVCHLDIGVLHYLQTIERLAKGCGYSKEAERGV